MIDIWHFDGMVQPQTIEEAIAKFDLYRQVARISVDDLEQAYYLSQHIDRDWTDNDLVYALVTRCRSSMVGDIFIRDGVMYFVDMIGFKQIEKQT